MKNEAINEPKSQIFDIPDIGNFDIPDFDVDAFDYLPDEVAETENRYIKPKLIPMKTDQVMYEYAEDLAKNIRIDKGVRYDCLVAGSFIFGDFIEAFLVRYDCKAIKMTITTLSLSQENVDSLCTLMQRGYIDKLDLVVSDYFYSHERHNLVPYMYEQLDIDNRFQLSVAFIHTKVINFLTAGGKKIVIHGSANLRSSGNVEQFTIEENAELFDWYEERFAPIIERFATIRKTAPRKQQWRDMTRKF